MPRPTGPGTKAGRRARDLLAHTEPALPRRSPRASWRLHETRPRERTAVPIEAPGGADFDRQPVRDRVTPGLRGAVVHERVSGRRRAVRDPELDARYVARGVAPTRAIASGRG